MMAAASLQLSGLSKRYPGVQALSHVDFECRPGEIHAVLGENGSGKSTLLGIAAGAVAADEGRIAIMGNPLVGADPLQARQFGLAVVYQDDSLVRELSVAENLLLGVVDGPRSLAGKRQWAAKQLAPYRLDISPDTLVGQLSASQRQFLEIVKALAANPKVLLLDEPTSSLDISGVETLTNIICGIVAAGAAVVYVSHRLPEILALADRVTILRDGVGQGTYEVNDKLSEADLIALMVGRPIDTEYPARGGQMSGDIVLSARGLSGARFRGVSFDVGRGEILGFAGSEGNGQREALRALGGLEESSGQVLRAGLPVKIGTPRAALDAGILSLSADRVAESIFPTLGVRENMTVQVLDDFARGGLISAAKEQMSTLSLIEQLNIVTADLDQPIGGLSGGNQQKAVLSRSFLYDAKALLIDEPTQGVDAKARFDIYRAIRAKADQGMACVVNSSDAMELAGICDRVLVFSRGRIIRELGSGEITEESIVAAFLRSKEFAAVAREASDSPPSGAFSLAGLRQLLAGGSQQWWVPLLLLLVLILIVGSYASLRTDVFLTPLNIRHILLATAPLALVTMAQFNVLMVRGFDVSVGAVISLTVVIASFLIAEELGAGLILFGALVCLAVGVVVGLTNGALVRYVGINSVITTIAMLSVVQGIALYLRPSPFGVISEDFIDFFQTRIGFVPVSFFLILAAAIAGDIWLYRTRSGLKLRAVGFREEAAKRNGVRIDFVHLRAYLLSAAIAVLSGLFVGSEVGVGAPVIGSSYTLTSIAAAVLGGAALTGGRGSFVGAMLGALFFTLTVNVIALLGLNTGAGIITSGALTLFAVAVYSGLQPIRRVWTNVRAAFTRPAAAVETP
jgi:ribose transport system permease protein/ribose transport system ATP-binding protein